MGYQLFLGDCLEVMPTIQTASVDLIFADPPFNVGISYKGYTDHRSDYYDWCAAWIAEGFRVLKDTGSFYLMTITRHLESLYPLMKSHGVFVNQVNWRNVARTNGKRSFWNEYQPIMVYGKTQAYKFQHLAETRKTHWVRFGGYSTEPKGQLLDYWDDIPFVYAGSITHKEAVLSKGTNKKAHPAQMPVALARRAILFSTDVGDTVLDPFSGSFTTAIACLGTQREFIGIEQSDEYLKLGEARIERFNSQPSLFVQTGSTPANNPMQATFLRSASESA